MEPKTSAADRWQDANRSNPDFVVYIPIGDEAHTHVDESATRDIYDRDNVSFLVTPTPPGTFLGFWTQATRVHGPDQRVVVARSRDRGQTWSRPTVIDGPEKSTEHIASWAFPVVVPHSGRVYCFFHKNVGPVDVDPALTGMLAYRYSDDDGLTWSERFQVSIARSAIDDPNPKMLSNWVPTGWETPIVNARGQVICGFTRWASNAYDYHENSNLRWRHHETWFLRFDNIFTEPDPAKLSVTTLPDAEHGIQVPRPDNSKISVAMEPSIENLSDGRLICLIRTLTGYIWYSISDDFGETWLPAEVLRFVPGGPPVPHPSAPCPLYKLRDGRFVLFFHNNDGTANGGTGPADSRGRRPVWISVAREIHNPGGQPLMFGRPKVLLDNDNAKAIVSERIGGLANYGSFVEYGGLCYWWYADRMHYLLGKIIRDELLDDAWLPR